MKKHKKRLIFTKYPYSPMSVGVGLLLCNVEFITPAGGNLLKIHHPPLPAGNTMVSVIDQAEGVNKMELREKLADTAHEQWCGWMRYLFSKGFFNADGSWVMPKWVAEKWKRQMETECRNKDKA